MFDHFLMAIESLLFPAPLFLILGNGAFKPNISTQVGSLYPPGDPRRDCDFRPGPGKKKSSPPSFRTST